MDPNQTTTQPPVQPQGSQVDQTIVNLARSIRDKESQGNYGATGDNGTSHGAFQYQPSTWKLYAGQVLNDPNAPMTPENQNAVTYGTLKRFKDSGMDAAQSVAAWNAGEKKAKDGSWQQNVGTNMINGRPVAYDTPGYVKDVLLKYQQYKSGVNQPAISTVPPAQPPQTQYPEGVAYAADGSEPTPLPPEKSLGQKLKDRAYSAYEGTVLPNIAHHLFGTKLNPIEQQHEQDNATAGGQLQGGLLGGLHVAGELGGAIGDIAKSGVELIPGVKWLEGKLGAGVQHIAATPTGQSIVSEMHQFAQNNPKTTQAAGDIFNIATAVPILKGLVAAKNAVADTVSSALEKTGLRASAEKTLAGTLVDAGVATSDEAPAIASTLSETGAIPDAVNSTWNIARAKNILTNSISRLQDQLTPFTSMQTALPDGMSIAQYTAEEEALQSSLSAQQTALRALTQLHGVPIIQQGPGLLGKTLSAVGAIPKKVVKGGLTAGLTTLGAYEGTNPNSFVRQFMSTGNPQ